jgi:hypothetical protein
MYGKIDPLALSAAKGKAQFIIFSDRHFDRQYITSSVARQIIAGDKRDLISIRIECHKAGMAMNSGASPTHGAVFQHKIAIRCKVSLSKKRVVGLFGGHCDRKAYLSVCIDNPSAIRRKG